ncbi:FG-GAP repeat domain-containing protein [Sorangium sp. So ce131]|uniref:FG-GAP repeat domain-containing protein n=1 Tax=Sorangium sp. So ce131 TaxID=3133282 RepID=UPI003F5E7331
MMRSRGASLALVMATSGCANLSLIEENLCGNGVVEEAADEACDGQDGCGAPGSAHQCRYLCAGDEAGVCPDGHGCGADGVCRRPRGEFEALVMRSTVTAMDLLVGDINDDGCDELVRTTLQGTTITALSSQAPGLCAQAEQALQVSQLVPVEPGDETSSASPPGLTPASLLRDLTGDGQLELIVARQGDIAEGIFVFSASGSAAMASTLYSSTRLGSASAHPLAIRLQDRDAALVFLGAAAAPGGMDGGGMDGGGMDGGGMDGGGMDGGGMDGGGSAGRVTLISDPSSKPQTFPEQIPVVPAEIVAAAAADLDEGAAGDCARCDEVIVAQRGDDRLRVYGVRGPEGARALAILPEITLDGGARIRERNASLAVLDQNGDGALDVVVNADDGKLHIAYGLGDGRFHSAEALPSSGAPDQHTSALAIPDAGELAHADNIFLAGDFDASLPGAELVPLPCRGAPFASPICDAVTWCNAVAADVNADGHLDIVASTAELPDLTVYSGASDGTFHPSLVPTQCPPRSLAVADVDGDRVNDIAYFDQRAQSSTERFPALDVAYGNAFAAPSAPAGHARLDMARGLIAGRFLPDGEGAQLFALRELPRPEEQGSQDSALAFVEGGRYRLLRAPFYFAPPPQEPRAVLPVRLLAVAAGSFAAGPSLAAITQHRDLATNAPRAGSEQLWLITVTPEGDNLLATSSGLPGELALPCDACVLVPVDTDNDGRDELLRLGGGELAVYGETDGKLVERGAPEKTRCTFRATDEDADPPEDAPRPLPKYTPRPLVADLDGDGWQDVVARAATGELVALWGRGDGGFDEAVLARPGQPGSEGELACAGEQVGAGLSAALINADADAALEVVVAGPGRLELHDLDAGARSLRQLDVSFPEGAAPPADSDFVAVGAGDFDGDGVGDVAIHQSATFFQVLRGKPVLE